MKKALIVDVEEITSRVSGKRVSSLEMLDDGWLTILFADGWTLGIAPGLSASVTHQIPQTRLKCE